MTSSTRTSISAGDRIVHPDLGAGVVRRSRRGGRALLVNFDSNPRLLLEVKAHEIKAEQPATKVHEAAPPLTPTKKMKKVLPKAGLGPFQKTGKAASGNSNKAARTLEALRLGVVPHTDLRSSSVGRDLEIELVRQDLSKAQASGAARVFLGDYGAGKTHLLEIVERESLDAGFLVGRATFDAEYVMPSHPMRVYREVATSLTYPDFNASTPPGLAPLFRKAIESPQVQEEIEGGRQGIGRHLYLRPALHFFKALDEIDDPVPQDLLLDWISGQRSEGNVELDTVLRTLLRTQKSYRAGPKIYSLKDFRPWAHVYAYLLGGISTLARKVGYRGLVILLDEAENFDLMGTAGRAFAEDVFSCLMVAALGPEGVSFAESAINKGGFPPQRKLPLMFQPHQHMYVVSAMTPSTAGENLLRRLVPDHLLSELTRLSQDSYHELSRRVVTIFETAYPEMRFGEQLSQPLGDVLWTLMRNNFIESPREATKLTVEFLDLIRLRHDAISAFFADVKRKLG